jgi:hypothetical protein
MQMRSTKDQGSPPKKTEDVASDHKTSKTQNAALRSRLEAPPSPAEMPAPTAANSQPHSSISSGHTAQLSANAGRIAYPATLPVFGAHPAGHWDGLLAEVALISRMAGALGRSAACFKSNFGKVVCIRVLNCSPPHLKKERLVKNLD